MISKFKIFVLLLIIVISVIFLYYFFTKETFKSKRTYTEELEDGLEKELNSKVCFINNVLDKLDIASTLNQV